VGVVEVVVIQHHQLPRLLVRQILAVAVAVAEVVVMTKLAVLVLYLLNIRKIKMANNYSIIENNKVVNTVISEVDFADKQGWVLLPDGVGIDWDYVDGEFVDNRPIPEVVATPAPTKEELLAQLQALTAQINGLA
jgi:hypothetical protein